MRSCDAAKTLESRANFGASRPLAHSSLLNIFPGTPVSSVSSRQSIAWQSLPNTRALSKSRQHRVFGPVYVIDLSDRKKLWRRKDQPKFDYPWKET